MNKTNYCTIYIVRHGESEANVAKLYGLNTRLTPNGRAQAKMLSKKFKNIHFDAVFSSPLLRAKETVSLITEERKLEILTKEALRERFDGIIDGRKAEEVRKEFGQMYRLRETLPYEKWKTMSIAEGYETDEELMSRFITALREIAIAYPGKSILIGSHVGLMKTFLIHLGQGTHRTLPSQAIANTGYIKLRSDGVDFFIDELHGIQREKKQYE